MLWAQQNSMRGRVKWLPCPSHTIARGLSSASNVGEAQEHDVTQVLHSYIVDDTPLLVAQEEALPHAPVLIIKVTVWRLGQPAPL